MQDLENKQLVRRRPWIKILLGLSLALNIAFLSFVGGAFLRSGGGPGRAPAPSLGAFGAPYMMALPREDRRDVLRDLRSSPEGLPNRKERREIFQEVLLSLRATPFDVEALRQVVTEQAGVSVRVQRRAQDVWIDKVAEMSETERRDYASTLEDLLKRGPKRR
ncbi:MAG: periplasmic heavy metal sensor [Roseobacter sp.]